MQMTGHSLKKRWSGEATPSCTNIMENFGDNFITVKIKFVYVSQEGTENVSFL